MRATGAAAEQPTREVFRTAHRLLSDTLAPGPGGGATETQRVPVGHAAAVQLLFTLDYARPGAENGGIVPTTADPATAANRLALLAIAGQIEQTFRLPMRHAPGAEFFGAMVRPGDFGIAGHDGTGAGGRGVSARQAFESCMGEAVEYLSFLERGDEDIDAAGDPLGLGDRELDWVAAGLGSGACADEHERLEACSMLDGRRVYLPAELVLRRPAPRRRAIRTAESTGLAAGPNLEAAMLAGLMEVVERDAAALWWHGRRPARAVHPAIAEEPGFRRFADAVRGRERPWWLLDVTTDVAVPAFAALSAEPDGGAVVAGFAAGLDPFAAARSAVLEMCQMELAQEISLAKLAQYGEERLDAQDRLWIDRHRCLSLTAFPHLCARQPLSRPNEQAVACLTLSSVLARLRDRGFDAYTVNLTRRELDVPVARVLVPGLQSPKPDWISRRLADCVLANGRPLDGIAGMVAPI